MQHWRSTGPSAARKIFIPRRGARCAWHDASVDGAPVNDAVVTIRRRAAWRYVVRASVTAAATAVLAFWLIMSAAIFALRCDDGCGSPSRMNWGYPAQFAVAGAACLLWLVALAFGFTSKRRIYRVLICASVAVTLAWWLFLFSGNF